MTGALGVIGKHLVPSLREHGYDVIGTDVVMADYTDYVRSDVTSFEDLYRIFKENRPDIVIHMAGEVGRMMGETYPQKMVYVNDIGVLNVMKLCIDYDSSLVYFSTSEVYGHLFDKGKPVKEEDLEAHQTAFGTTNVYAMSKLFGEALVKHYVEDYKLKAVTIRPFMVYGPGETPSKFRSAICNFVHAALNKKKFVVHQGTMRSWCYITDFIEGVRLVMEQPASKKYEAYNVGSNEYKTAEEVAHTVIDVCGANRNLVKIVDPPKQFITPVKIASIEKVQKLGYSPKVSLREGVKKVMQWQKDMDF